MPFKSEAQRKFLYANYPEMAKRWQKHTPKDADLPEHVKKKKTAGLLSDFAKSAERGKLQHGRTPEQQSIVVTASYPV